MSRGILFLFVWFRVSFEFFFVLRVYFILWFVGFRTVVNNEKEGVLKTDRFREVGVCIVLFSF